jgi:hypothetical protein
MKYFKVNEQLQVVAISDDYPDELRNYDPETSCPWYRKADGRRGAGWLNRNDIDSFMLAQVIADAATEFSGQTYLATDAGDHTSSRYDAKPAPVLGDDASMGFNGDYYPVGKIIAIGKTFRQIKVSGDRGVITFYRRKLSGAWLHKGFSLVPGIINRWNPEF